MAILVVATVSCGKATQRLAGKGVRAPTIQQRQQGSHSSLPRVPIGGERLGQTAGTRGRRAPLPESSKRFVKEGGRERRGASAGWAKEEGVGGEGQDRVSSDQRIGSPLAEIARNLGVGKSAIAMAIRKKETAREK